MISKLDCLSEERREKGSLRRHRNIINKCRQGSKEKNEIDGIDTRIYMSCLLIYLGWKFEERFIYQQNEILKEYTNRRAADKK